MTTKTGKHIDWRNLKVGEHVTFRAIEFGITCTANGIVTEVDKTHAILFADDMNLWIDDDTAHFFHRD